MLAHCAIKAKAEAIYSWNARHYALVRPGSDPAPADPLSISSRRPSERKDLFSVPDSFGPATPMKP